MARIFELLLFEQVDLLDVGGPYEVLLTANRLVEREGGSPPFEIRTIAPDDAPVTAYGGLGLVPSHRLADEPPADVFLVPGAIDLDAVTADGRLLSVIADRAPRADLVSSVCTGSVLLARAGQLDVAMATTHHEDLDVLAGTAPGTEVRRARWVDAGRTVTAGGLSSGIAMALHLVDRLHSVELARRTAVQLGYDWDPSSGIDLDAGDATAARP